MITVESLPRHAASLTITHNDHKDCYRTAAQQFAEWEERGHTPNMRAGDWKERMIEADEIWEVQWYANSPVGFCNVAAPSLEEAVEFAKEIQDAEDATGKTYSSNDPNIRAVPFTLEPQTRILSTGALIEHSMDELASEFSNMLNGAKSVASKDKLWNEFADFRRQLTLDSVDKAMLSKEVVVIKIAGFQHRCVRVTLAKPNSLAMLFLYLVYDKSGIWFGDVFKYQMSA